MHWILPSMHQLIYISSNLCSIAEESIMKLQLLYSEREKVMKAIMALQSSAEVTAFLPGSSDQRCDLQLIKKPSQT